jgi:hypothetical protein
VKEHCGPVSWKSLLTDPVILLLSCLPFPSMIPNKHEIVAEAERRSRGSSASAHDFPHGLPFHLVFSLSKT